MTFEEAHQILLKELDSAFMKLKELHEKPDYLNDEHRDYKTASENFIQIQKDLFKLKDVWYRFQQSG